MAPQELEKQPTQDSCAGPLAAIQSLGLAGKRKRAQGEMAWRKTVTQHEPEPWPAARLALQARIAALG